MWLLTEESIYCNAQYSRYNFLSYYSYHRRLIPFKIDINCWYENNLKKKIQKIGKKERIFARSSELKRINFIGEEKSCCDETTIVKSAKYRW